MTQPTTPNPAPAQPAWVNLQLKLPRPGAVFQHLFSGPAWTWSASALVASSLSHSGSSVLYHLTLSSMAAGHYLLAHSLLFMMIGVSTFGWLREKLRRCASPNRPNGRLPEPLRRATVAAALLGWIAWHGYLAFAL